MVTHASMTQTDDRDQAMWVFLRRGSFRAVLLLRRFSDNDARLHGLPLAQTTQTPLIFSEAAGIATPYERPSRAMYLPPGTLEHYSVRLDAHVSIFASTVRNRSHERPILSRSRNVGAPSKSLRRGRGGER